VSALVASALLVLPVTARAASTGSGGWYWPTGSERFGTWDGWWEYRAQSPVRWHMAQDMPADVGHVVYAVGDGTVIESGGNHGYNSVVIVLHRTAAGEYFKAVYGHIRLASGTGKGAKVKAGQVIGRVNGDRHVHFGIHPGKAYPSDNNPYRGHTYTSKNTYGWVDPVAYLRNHPRLVVVPALPVVATVATTECAAVLGVADGSAYWTVGSGESMRTFSRGLAGGEPAPVTADVELPALDCTRFSAIAGATSFTLSDRLPRLSGVASAVTVAWKRPVTMSGRLTNAAGKPFVGVPVALESSADGGATWTRIGTAPTGPTGAYAIRWTPSRRRVLRVTFAGRNGYLTRSSVSTTVAPRPALTAPAIPKGADDDHSMTVRGAVSPRHVAGASAVVLRVQRKRGTTWVDHSSVATVYRDSATASVAQGVMRLPAGTWRVRTESPADSAHASARSAWTCFVLR